MQRARAKVSETGLVESWDTMERGGAHLIGVLFERAHALAASHFPRAADDVVDIRVEPRSAWVVPARADAEHVVRHDVLRHEEVV